MKILLADSYDNGSTWSKLRKVNLPNEIGPPSLTNPIMKLPNGKLIMSIENNKHYYNQSKWYQKNVFICSIDNGKTWSCLLYTSPSPRDRTRSRMPSSA